MLEVSVEQTLLSKFILRSVSGGVTPSTIPYITEENLAKAHRTPSVTCGHPLRSLSRSLARTSRIPLGVDNGKTRHLHLTYSLSIHGSLYLTYMNGHHESVIYSLSGEPPFAYLNFAWLNILVLNDIRRGSIVFSFSYLFPTRA